MIVAPFGNNLRKDSDAASKLSGSSSHNAGLQGVGGTGGGASLAPPSSSSVGGAQSPAMIYQHIHDMATKRISTLEYLRRALVAPKNLHATHYRAMES